MVDQYDKDLIRRITALEYKIDNLPKMETGKWVNWTPTVTQSGLVSTTISYARYVTNGNIVAVLALINITGTGTANNAVIIGGIPAAIQPAHSGTSLVVIGTMLVIDSGTAYYHGALVSSGITSWAALVHNGGAQIGVAPNFALANGDYIGIQAVYEKA